ncbi:hypothetical protein BASA81_005135 [Batrachochytrium salamandrivorans]|nr:hypothetical protein BASA81_005135 [Batrachochytrium salamandrivorans]
MLPFDSSQLSRLGLAASMENLGEGYETCLGSEWEATFPQHFERLFVQSLQAPQDAVRAAQQGLQFLHSNVQYGATQLDFAIEQTKSSKHLQSTTYPGGGSGGLLQSRTFVCLNGMHSGAPTKHLLDLGATVYMIEGKDIGEFARSVVVGGGNLIVVRADLQTELGEIAHFLVEQLSLTSSSTICNTQYDELGKSLAVDALIEHICNRLTDTIVAHVVTSQASCHLVSIRTATTQTVQERQTGGGGKVPLGNAIRTEKHLGRLDSERKVFEMENHLRVNLGCEFAMAHLVSQWRILLARQLGTYRWLTDKRKHRVSVSMAGNPQKLVGDLSDPLASPTIQLDNAYQLYMVL